MEKTIAKRFWQKVWDRYVNKQKYKVDGSIKDTHKDKSDSYMVSQAIWFMSDKEFDKLIHLVSKKTTKR